MAKMYCQGCKEEHEDHNWKNTTYTLEDGERSGWYCRKYFKPSHTEWTTDSIKEQRKVFKKDLLQPFRGGEPNKEFIKEYPNESKNYFSKEEIKKVKKKVL